MDFVNCEDHEENLYFAECNYCSQSQSGVRSDQIRVYKNNVGNSRNHINV